MIGRLQLTDKLILTNLGSPSSKSMTATRVKVNLRLPASQLSRPHGSKTVSFAASTSTPRPVWESTAIAEEPTVLKPLPREVEGPADDPSLHNPLKRLERLGTGWMGVIMELEGVCVELEYGDVSAKAWIQLAQEEGKEPPFQWALKRAEGMKNEQVISEVFCWTRNPVEMKRLAKKKEEILKGLLGDRKPLVPSGVLVLLDTLRRNGVPVALVASAPESRVHGTLEEAGLSSSFDTVLTADDVHRGKPDPEAYLYAAQALGRPPIRCVVIGAGNLSIEAAHEVGMQCMAVAGAGRHPVYELSAADMVVRDLGDVSFVNMKKLFSLEESVASHIGEEDEEAVPESESEEEVPRYAPATVLDRPDDPW